jgi:hypothetical protein
MSYQHLNDLVDKCATQNSGEVFLLVLAVYASFSNAVRKDWHCDSSDNTQYWKLRKQQNAGMVY